MLAGTARFTLSGEEHEVPAQSVVVVNDPAVRRAATSAAYGTLLLAVGGAPGSFETTWRAQHFERVPQAD